MGIGRDVRLLLIPPNDLLRHPIPNRMFHIAKRLAKKHEIVLLSYTKHPLASNAVQRTLPGFEVSLGKSISTKNLGLYYVVNVAQIYGAIKHAIKDVDAVIHANILPSLIATRLAKKLGIPAVYDYLDYFPESASAYYTKGKWAVETGVWTITTETLRNSDAAVVPSHGLKAAIREAAPHVPIYVIPNGVDAEVFKPIDQKTARKTLNLDTDPRLVLLQGSIDVWIDVAQALKAISRLRQQFDVRILAVGFSHKKQYYNQLLQYAKKYGLEKYIYAYPPQPYEKMPIFINASDVVLSAYVKQIKNFATPLKIAEALACGVPVVATEILEYKLWYRQGVYTYKNYSQLEQVLRTVLTGLAEIKKTLIIYSQFFRRHFSWDRLAEKYELVLGSITRRS